MIIKEADKHSLFREKIDLWLKGPNLFRRIVLLCLGIILISTIVLISTIFGMHLHKTGIAHFVNASIRSSSKLAVVPNYLKGLTSKPEHIDIDINFTDFQKLSYKREEALELGHLISSEEDWVPARIRHNGLTYRVDMRLKGDRPFHWARDPDRGWSFKIKVKGNDSLFGMKRFAIQHPMTRNYLDEWFLHKLLEYSGLVALQYDFVEVTINGKRQPIYAVEENFEKRLIENNRHREGLIIRFDTLAYWEGKAATWEQKPGVPPVLLGAPINPYQQNRIMADDNLTKQFNVAKNLLEMFKEDKLIASDVFDIDKLAIFFAITDLLGNYHATPLDNLRFYYNPVTSLIEPIGYDNEEIMPRSDKDLLGSWKIIGREIEYPEMKEVIDSTRWHYAVFKDKEFFKKYVLALEKVSEKKFLDDFFGKTDKEYKEKLRILHKDYPWYSFEKKQLLYENQKNIKDFLAFKRNIHVYFNDFSPDKCILSLEVCNLRSLPIEVLSVNCGDKTAFRPVKETIVQAAPKAMPVTYNVVELTSPDDFSWSDSMIADLKMNYKVLGASRVCYEVVTPWSRLEKDLISTDLIRQPSNMQKFDFLLIDEKTKSVFFKPGEWNLPDNLIIPKGYTVIAEGGLKLNLSNKSKIISYSPIRLIGIDDNPIIIRSLDSTGQGIIVMANGKESLLEFVHFDNLSNPSQGGWELTGAVTFYESPVKISNCFFARNRAEDALNIIRADFEIDRTLFKENSSDAFDADFAKGNISKSSFFDCGNDAIDVSGSIIEAEDIFVNKAGDKGISVGEKSKATINGIEIKNSELAMASKDLSELIITKAAILDCKTGLAVYQKKPEFGPAYIRATDITMEEVNNPHVIEEGSKLDLIDEAI